MQISNPFKKQCYVSPEEDMTDFLYFQHNDL